MSRLRSPILRAALLATVCSGSLVHGFIEQDPDEPPPMTEPGPAPASPLDSGCLALAMNRSAQVNPDGTFLVNNVPSTLGLVRVRFVCARASGILGGQTGFLMPAAGDVVDAGNLSSIVLGVMPAIPTRLVVTTQTTRHVVEVDVATGQVLGATETRGEGSVWDVAFSPDPQQRQLYVADGQDQRVFVLDRETLTIVSAIGGGGRWPGAFFGVGSVAVDSRGNVYTGENFEGKRLQKFITR